MADSSVGLSMDEISKLKVADLKKELKMRGLSTVGNKNELVERLQLAYDSLADNDSPLDAEELLDEEDEDVDDVLADDVSLEEEDLGELKTPVVSKPSVGLKRKPDESVVASQPPKKLVRNRTAVTWPGKENLEEKAAEETHAEPEEADKPSIVKITALTAKERLEIRAAKFGITVPVTADIRKEVRAARFGVTTSSAAATESTSTGANVDVLKKRAERFGTSVSSTLAKVAMDEKLQKRRERFGVVEPETTVKATVKAVPVVKTTATAKAVSVVKSTTTSSSVKVPITMGSSAVPVSAGDDKKKMRAERFKITL